MKIQRINFLIPNKKINQKHYNNNVYEDSVIELQNVGLRNFFYYPLSFSSSVKRINSTNKAELAEKSGNFLISKYNDIPCPACGKKMLNMEKYEQIAEEMASIPPEEYLDCLGKYKEYMRPVEESVYNEIYELSQTSGSEKDIRTLLVNLRQQKLPILQQVQMYLIKKMQSLIKTLPNNEKAVLTGKVNRLKDIVRKNNSNSPFRRKILIDRIGKVKIQNPKKYEKLQNIAKSFPTSSDMNSAWIVKYSGKNKQNEDWNSYDIALRFLYSSIANTDHIIAYDLENNHDDISNYLAMHNACNSHKSNKTFLHWLNENKDNRIQYMNDYFDYVDENIIKTKKVKKKYPKYLNYVNLAKDTIFEASKGQIDIKGQKK